MESTSLSERTLKIEVQYCGRAFFGWQRQESGVPTIQAAVEDALAAVLQHSVTIEGSGRTDRGVHARAHPASFSTGNSLPTERILAGANAHLPATIALISIDEVDPGFHARYDACWKTYRYSIDNGPVRSPLLAATHHHDGRGLIVARMQEAARAFVGRHDFYSLATMGWQKESTIRTIFDLQVQRRAAEPDRIEIDVTGDGFLYNQVRTLAGTLLEVGLGTRDPSSCRRLLQTRDRTLAGPNLPAHGLALLQVGYVPFLSEPGQG